MNITAPYKEPPDPYATLLGLLMEHGEAAVLQDLASYFDSELESIQGSDNACPNCVRKYIFVSETLQALASRFGNCESSTEEDAQYDAPDGNA